MANNWKALQDGLNDGLKALLNDVLEDVSSDLDGPVREIAERLAFAAKRQRMDLVEECKDQLLLIALENGLRTRDAFSDILDTAIGLGLNALINGALGGLAAIKPR